MPAYGLRADEEPLGDFAVAESFPDETQHLGFAKREVVACFSQDVAQDSREHHSVGPKFPIQDCAERSARLSGCSTPAQVPGTTDQNQMFRDGGPNRILFHQDAHQRTKIRRFVEGFGRYLVNKVGADHQKAGRNAPTLCQHLGWGSAAEGHGTVLAQFKRYAQPFGAEVAGEDDPRSFCHWRRQSSGFESTSIMSLMRSSGYPKSLTLSSIFGPDGYRGRSSRELPAVKPRYHGDHGALPLRWSEPLQ